MRKLLRKIRPIVMILGVIITFFLSLKIYENFKFNFNQAVQESLHRFADINIKFKKISFPEVGVVLLHDVELRDKKDSRLVVAKELTLKYDHRKFSEITEIKVSDADITFEMYGDYDNNFVDSFKGSGKSSGSSILKKIIFEKSRLYYIDKMNTMPIYRYVNEINGYVNFGNSGKIDIAVRGSSGSENYFFGLEYLPKKLTNITLDMKNIKIDNQIMQYGYYDSTIDYKNGVADLTLKIDRNGNLNGNCQLKNGELKYQDVLKKINNINGNINFKGRKIVIAATGNVENKPLKFGLYYNLDEKAAKISISGNNLQYKDLENYYLIKDAGINAEGNIEKVAAEIAINREKKVNVIAKAESKELKIYGEIVKDINIKAVINEKRFSVDNCSFKYLDYEAGNVIIKGEITSKGVSGNYKIDNMKIPADIYSAIGNFDYNQKSKSLLFSLKAGEKALVSGKYDFNQQRLSLESEIKEATKVVYGNYSALFNGKILLEYDTLKDYMALNILFNPGCSTIYEGKSYNIEGSAEGNFRPKRKEFSGGKGEITLFGVEGIDNIFVKFSSEKDNIDLNSVVLKKGNSFANLSGFYNISRGNYMVNVVSSEIEISDLPGITGTGLVTATGVISGTGIKTVESELEVRSEAGVINQIGYENLYYNLDLAVLDGKSKVNGVGEIGKLIVFGEELNDIKNNFRIRDDIVYIDNFYNNSLTLNGYYNIINKSLDIKYSVKNYEIERTSVLKGTDITGYVTELTGEVSGNAESPYVKTNILKAEISYGKFQKIKVNGEIEYSNDKIKFENLKINQNTLNGEYSINTREIEGKINVFESEIPKYLGINDITFRTIGELNFWGNIGDLKGTAEVTLDSAYYKDKKLPVIYGKLNYNKLDLNNFANSGVFNLSAIKIVNSKKKSIVEGTGIYNNETKAIEVNVDNRGINLQTLEFEKLQENNLNGTILVDFKLRGKLNDFDYSCSIKSENLELYDVKIDSLNLKISGNKEQMSMPEFILNYGGNIFAVKGSIQYNPLKYNFRLYGKDVDLKVLNILAKNKINGIKGIGNVDVSLNEKSINGEISLKDTGFATVDKAINYDKINASIIIDGEKAVIKSFNGELNGGKTNISGEVKIGEAGIGFAGLKKISFDSWNINFDFSEVKYNIENMMYVFCSGKGKLKDKNLEGTIIVERGEIRSLGKKGNKDKSKFEIPKDWKASIDFSIKNQMRVNIEKVLLIDGVEANIEGGGFLTLENGQLNIIGTISTDKGAVEVNGKIFKIESGVVVFDDPYQYFPNLNPSIAVRAVTDVVAEEIYVDITGDINKPLLVLSSNNNLEQSDIISLLTFNSTVNQSTPTGVVKDIIENRINEEIFNPISEKLSKTLGISKVKISSNLLEDDTEEVRITKDIRLGAEIEFSDRLYKDTLYWNLKTKLSDKTAGELESYNFWLDYKIKNETAISAGVEKINNEDNEKDKINLHIGLEFKKKFDINFGGNK